MGDNTKPEKSPLLPDRMQQGDFFVCDIFDAAPKGDMASMEHPIFSISTKPDRNIREYRQGSNFVKVTPSVEGLATVHDRDILIFCISQVIAAMNEGKPVDRKLRFAASDLLRATNRGTDGRGYEQLRAALSRLAGTRVETNITTNDLEILDGFGLISEYRIVRKTRDGRMEELEITLSDWVFNAINAREVLTYSREYFRLRKPLERRLYEIARKHCGRKQQWPYKLENIQKKVGSRSTLFEFRRLVNDIVNANNQHDHFPDYTIELDESDTVTFKTRGTVPAKLVEAKPNIVIPEWAEEKARVIAVQKGWDYQVLKSEWLALTKRKEPPKNAGAAFIGFCKKKPALR